MDGYLHRSRTQGSSGVLFDEDFDAREPMPEPEVIEPVFSASELASARDAAWRDGHASGLEEATAADTAATRQAVEAIVQSLDATRRLAAEQAEQNAESIAHLLLDSLAAVFPALCTRYGDAEVKALVGAVLPGLSQEPSITVRTNPRTARMLAREFHRVDPDIAARVQFAETEATPPGDVRITWRNGSATRDAAVLWQQVTEILMPVGLLRPQAAIREMADVE